MSWAIEIWWCLCEVAGPRKAFVWQLGWSYNEQEPPLKTSYSFSVMCGGAHWFNCHSFIMQWINKSTSMQINDVICYWGVLNIRLFSLSFNVGFYFHLILSPPLFDYFGSWIACVNGTEPCFQHIDNPGGSSSDQPSCPDKAKQQHLLGWVSDTETQTH